MSDKESGALPEGVEWPMVDGEPVMPGDVLWDRDGTRRRVTEVRFWREGCYAVMDDSGGREVPIVNTDGWTRTKPPKPVFDRDGVPIEVGDTVYMDCWGDLPIEVISLDPESPVPVRIENEYGTTGWFEPENLTHERPDSWARLEEDARKVNYERYWGCKDTTTCADCPAKVDGVMPHDRYRVGHCDTAMVSDIVRRAKALAGVVADD